MNCKRYLVFLVVAFFSIIAVNKVNAAAPSSINMFENGKVYENSAIGTNVSSDDEFYFSYKYNLDNNCLVFCVTDRTAAALTGTYSKANWGKTETRIGIGAIINEGVGNNSNTSSFSNSSSNLFLTQIAIWKYLKDTGVYTNNSLDYVVSTIGGSDYSARFNAIYNAAKTAVDEYNQYTNGNITVNVSMLSNVDKIQFSKVGDYYQSNPINITGNFDSITYQLTGALSDVAIVEKTTDNSYIIKVPISSLKVGSNEVRMTFNGTKSVSKVFYAASKYSKSGSAQDITVTQLDDVIESVTGEKTLSLDGSISIDTSLTLRKLDEDGKHLSGSTIKVTKNGENFGEYSLPDKEYIIKGLSYGEYCITEVKAPDGYILSNEKKCVTLSAINLNGTLTLTNKKNTIKFKKVSLVDGEYKLLPNAILKIVDSEGNQIYDIDGNELKWKTDENIYVVNGLAPGIYYLEEEKSPSGYSIGKKIRFYVYSNKIVSTNLESTLKILDKDTLTIVMKNELIKTSFSKVDVTTGKELAGATLQVLDKDKNPIIDEEGNILYKWVSTDEPYIIEGLPAGIYYLKEEIAPAGYTKTEELVEFEVKDDGTITEVVMKNSPIVDVPNTAKSASIPMIIISVILLASGLGIILFVVYKNKKA